MDSVKTATTATATTTETVTANRMGREIMMLLLLLLLLCIEEVLAACIRTVDSVGAAIVITPFSSLVMMISVQNQPSNQQ